MDNITTGKKIGITNEEIGRAKSKKLNIIETKEVIDFNELVVLDNIDTELIYKCGELIKTATILYETNINKQLNDAIIHLLSAKRSLELSKLN